MDERDDIAALKAQNAALVALIKILEEQLRLAAVRMFAPKSETLASLAQFDLFNEAEVLGTTPDTDAQAAVRIPMKMTTCSGGKRPPVPVEKDQWGAGA